MVALLLWTSLAVGALFVVACVWRRKAIDRIVIGQIRRRRETSGPRQHIFFCFVDHFEPFRRGATKDQAIERVRRWQEHYPRVVDSFRDRSGRPPQHSFFYPAEEYAPECLDLLAELVRDGYGDVEIHLHHDGDTAEGLRTILEDFKTRLHERHGLLRRNPLSGHIEYGFIHGNWALDDSGVDGRWCGVRGELAVLRDTGCYADFTYPSAPHRTQPPIVNEIYYASGDAARGRGHHRGVPAEYGVQPNGELLLVTGPVGFDWRDRKWGLLPRIENSDVSAAHRPLGHRVDLWVKTGIAVKGWPDWVFVKVHTHGAKDANASVLLHDTIQPMHERLCSRYNDGELHILHYVTAYELYRCVGALESGRRDAIEAVENFNYSWT